MRYYFKCTGTSMIPTIMPNQIICVDTDTLNELKIGDIIVYKKRNLRCHRIIKKFIFNNKIYFLTKGDHNKEKDSYVVTLDEIIGIVSYL